MNTLNSRVFQKLSLIDLYLQCLCTKKKMQHKISAIGVFKRHFCSESLQSPGINKLSSLNLFVVVYHY